MKKIRDEIEKSIRRNIVVGDTEYNGTKCWLWSGNLSLGYGIVSQSKYNPYSSRAHRASYEYYRGKIPEGLFVCHHCDVKRCINPDHLFVGTNSDNINDYYSKPISNGTRIKISEANKGKLFTEKHREKIAGAFKGKTFSEERCKNIKVSLMGKQSGANNPMFGKKHSVETRAKISTSLKGKKPTVEARKKMSESRKGRKLSDEHKAKLLAIVKNPSFETRAKISAAHKGKIFSDATRLKMSEAAKNRVRSKTSDETKAKMSLIRKLYWEDRRSGKGNVI